MGNVSRKKGKLKKDQKEMLEIEKIKIGEMNAFCTLIYGMSMAKERICELAEMSVETPKVKCKEKKKEWKKGNIIAQNCGTIIKGVIHTQWEYHRRQTESKGILEAI